MIRKTLISAVVAAAFAAPAAAQQVTFMTGPQGGSWIPLGGALKGMWEKEVSGLQIQQTPGAGISNVRGIDEGKAQIGIANSSTTVDGLEGRVPYPKKVTKVCQLANLYPQYWQVVALANANVNTFADFKGKSLTTQAKGNTGELLTAPRFRGRVYVKGIWVRTDPSLAYGYNFFKATLDIDRNMVEDPETLYVADFLGASNLMRATIVSADASACRVALDGYETWTTTFQPSRRGTSGA